MRLITHVGLKLPCDDNSTACLLHADCVESVKRGGVKLSSLRCRLAGFLSLHNKIYCLVFALLLLFMY